MPRFDDIQRTVAKSPPKPERRVFPRPWTIEMEPAAFMVLDDNGVVMFRVPFVPQETRALFPESQTYDEALALVRWMVTTVEEKLTEFEQAD